MPAVFEHLVSRLQHHEAGFPHLIAADTLEILAAVLAAARPEPEELVLQGPLSVKTVTDPIVADAVRLIWRASGQTVNVEEIVGQLPVTRRSLERRFRKKLGVSVHEEINRCRMDRAVRLLEHTELLIKNIAIVAGFPSLDALEDTFRRSKGVSPSEYRKNRQQRTEEDA